MSHSAIELALDYAHAGLFDEAINLLAESPSDDAMALVYLGWCYDQNGDEGRARSAFRAAAEMPRDYCFPNRIECIAALETAMRLNPDDARAPYYLGNFWYAHRQYEDAIRCWEKALELDEGNPTAHRNLGLALMNKRADCERALHHYERAFALDQSDARILFELDQLYVKIGKSPSERLAFLQQHRACVDRRDDLTIELATLHNLLGHPQEALDIIMSRVFHPWEGGEGEGHRAVCHQPHSDGAGTYSSWRIRPSHRLPDARPQLSAQSGRRQIADRAGKRCLLFSGSGVRIARRFDDRRTVLRGRVPRVI